jgi:hypothetical protein
MGDSGMTDEKEPTNAPLSEGFVIGDETWRTPINEVPVPFPRYNEVTHHLIRRSDEELRKMSKTQLRRQIRALEAKVDLRDLLINERLNERTKESKDEG